MIEASHASTSRELAHLNVEVRRLDGVDVPALGEGVAQLVLSHPPRAPVPGLALAETEQKEPSAWAKRAANAACISRTILVLEHMKDSQVGGGVEALIPLVEVENVRDVKADRDAAAAGFVACLADRLRRSVDADSVQP